MTRPVELVRGNGVVVTGSAFTGATGVKFGASAASFVVDSDTRITAVAPAGSGVVDVTVTPAAFGVISDSLVVANAPAHAAGTVDIEITTTGGAAPAIEAFTYTP